MTDIYDIKDIVLGLPINIINSFIFLLFIFVAFIFIKFFLKNQKQIQKVEVVKEEKKEKKDFMKIIKQFKKEHIGDNFNKFYSWLLMILREILEEKWYKDISKMTLTEIWNLNLEESIKKLIQSIYFKEYKEKIKDNLEIREKYIKDITNLIK